MNASFTLNVTGERKAVMAVIAGITGTEAVYTRAPRFAYEAGGWFIDRAGVLTSPAFPFREADFHANLIGALGEAGFAAEGAMAVTVYPEPFDAACLGNVNALLAAKATLIRHALGTDAEPSARIVEGGGFVFPFFPAATGGPAVLAAIQLSVLAASQAASQKRVRARERPVENEKYAMRCFLLRIGMIGPEYVIARKELLSRLSGDASFKNGARPAAATPEYLSEADSFAEALADAELIHGVNALFAEDAAPGPPRGDCLACAASMSEPAAGSDRLFCAERREYVPEDGFCAAFNR